jgi:hypothetical protein
MPYNDFEDRETGWEDNSPVDDGFLERPLWPDPIPVPPQFREFLDSDEDNDVIAERIRQRRERKEEIDFNS